MENIATTLTTLALSPYFSYYCEVPTISMCVLLLLLLSLLLLFQLVNYSHL